MTQLVNALRLGGEEKTAIFGQIFLSGCQAENRISVEHCVCRADGPCNSIVGHLGNFLGLGLGQGCVRGDQPDGGILNRSGWRFGGQFYGALALPSKFSVDLYCDFPGAAGIRIDNGSIGIYGD